MKRIALILAALLLLGACTKDQYTTDKRYSRVLVLYLSDHTNLYGSINNNLSEILGQDLPFRDSDKALLVFRHPVLQYYSTPSEPVLFKVSTDIYGKLVCDTLKTFSTDSRMTDPELMRSALQYVKDKFPSDHYGMLYSSHGTGWLPEFYYSDGADPENEVDIWESTSSKSMGSHVNGDELDEMELSELASAIPMHLDYLIFDACLMGCVEVAYELRSTTDYLVASSAEILTSGMEYAGIVGHLLKDAPYSLLEFCEAYYEKYNSRTAASQTALVSLTDCRELDELAGVCCELFETYREPISTLGRYDVQGFFTGNHPWFFDLRDILVKAGASIEELSRLDLALDACIPYKANTPRILYTVKVDTFCGLSMYLPSCGSNFLNQYYKRLEWNKATGLVK